MPLGTATGDLLRRHDDDLLRRPDRRHDVHDHGTLLSGQTKGDLLRRRSSNHDDLLRRPNHLSLDSPLGFLRKGRQKPRLSSLATSDSSDQTKGASLGATP